MSEQRNESNVKNGMWLFLTPVSFLCSLVTMGYSIIPRCWLTRWATIWGWPTMTHAASVEEALASCTLPPRQYRILTQYVRDNTPCVVLLQENNQWQGLVMKRYRSWSFLYNSIMLYSSYTTVITIFFPLLMDDADFFSTWFVPTMLSVTFWK